MLRSVSALHLALALSWTIATPAAWQDDPPSSATPTKSAESRPDAEIAKRPKTAPEATAAEKAADTKGREAAAEPSTAGGTVPEDLATVRDEVQKRLKTLAAQDGKSKEETSASKSLRKLLEERLQLLEDLEKERKASEEMEQPENSPEKEGEQLKKDLERVRAKRERAVKDPSSLLPDLFRGHTERVSPTTLGEMKEEIEAAKNELIKRSTELEDFRTEPTSKGGSKLSKLRAERDKIHQDCAAMPSRQAEGEAALAAATSAEARELATERLANITWETHLEQQRLRSKEAQILVETKRAALAPSHLKLLEGRRELAKWTLEAMQSLYGPLMDRQQRELSRAAADEQGRAQIANDPLERFRATQAANLLALEALALRDERALSASPRLSLEAQKDLADRAVKDFQSLKKLVDQGRASSLVALRLKNDYRRISMERAAVARTDLAEASDVMTRCENALAGVELDLVNDSRDDRYLLDELLESLPASRRDQAKRLAASLEEKHRALLTQRKAALEALADRAQAIHEQVTRRLQILDDQYAYVRTHIFWMRDAEPMGPATMAPVPGELHRLAQALLRLARECGNRASWGRVSAAFVLTLLATIALPWPIHRARIALKASLHSVAGATVAASA